MSAIDEEISAAGVAAEIGYLNGDSPVNRRFVAAGVEINTGHYAPQRVRIRNGRPFRRRLGFHSHGFQLVRRPSRVSDFFDRAQVDAIYPGEVVEAVQELTGATRVVPMGWMIRTSGDLSQFQQKTVGYTHQGGVQPPAAEAHVDFAPDRARRLATMLYKKAVPDGPGFGRFIATSFWRTFSPPPQDWPLALCDGRSVDDSEGVNNTLVVVDTLPTPEVGRRALAGRGAVAGGLRVPLRSPAPLVVLPGHDARRGAAVQVPRLGPLDARGARRTPRSTTPAAPLPACARASSSAASPISNDPRLRLRGALRQGPGRSRRLLPRR